MKVTKINAKGLSKALRVPNVLFLLDKYNLRSIQYQPTFEKFASLVSEDAPFRCLMIDAEKYKDALRHIGYIVGDNITPVAVFNDAGVLGGYGEAGNVTALKHYIGERDLLRCCSQFFKRRTRRSQSPRGSGGTSSSSSSSTSSASSDSKTSVGVSNTTTDYGSDGKVEGRSERRHRPGYGYRHKGLPPRETHIARRVNHVDMVTHEASSFSDGSDTSDTDTLA